MLVQTTMLCLIRVYVIVTCPTIFVISTCSKMEIISLDVKGREYTWYFFRHLFYKVHNYCDFPFAFFSHQIPSEKGSTVKGNYLLPMGANDFLLDLTILHVRQPLFGFRQTKTPVK